MEVHVRISALVTATLALCIITAPAASAPRDRAAEALYLGKKALYEGKLKEGILKLEEANSIDAGNPVIVFFLAKGYSWNGELDRAEEYYRKAMSMSNTNDDIYWQASFGIAQTTAWRKQYALALERYQEILSKHQKTPPDLKEDVLLAMGDVHAWQKEYPAAISLYEKALADRPASVEVLNRLGQVYLWDKNYKASRAYTEKALAIESNNIEARRRLDDLDLIKNYTLTLGYAYTSFDANNPEGNKIQRHTANAYFDWQAGDDLRMHVETTVLTQNYVDSADPGTASSWNSDVRTGIGVTNRFTRNTTAGMLFTYTYSPDILPDFSGEASITQKISPIFDITGLYRLTYDKKAPERMAGAKKASHLVSPGIILYFTEMFYSRLQGYMDTDGKNTFYSFMLQQTYAFSARDKTDFYISYGKGKNYLVYSDATIPLDVVTFSITLAHTHFFNPSFGLRPSFMYHNRVNYYEDYSFGLEGVYQF